MDRVDLPNCLRGDLAGLSLRANFSWTFIGNAVYAGTQWALILLMAKLFSPEVFGRFALALSVVTPIFVAGGLQLRAVMVSDTQESTPFARYLALRLVTSFLALLVLILVAILGNFSPQLFWMALFLGLGQAAIMVKDIFQGAMQRQERMDLAAISLVLQGALTLIIVVAFYSLFRNAVVLTAGMSAGRLLVLGFFDIPCSRALSRPGSLLFQKWCFPKPGDFSDLFSLARLALPLGVVTLLISLQANIPRYFLAGMHGDSAIGFFAALATFMSMEDILTSALGQSAAHRLSLLHAVSLRRYRNLLGRLVLAGAGIGLAGFLIARQWGEEILRLFFRDEYAQFANVLTWLMLAQLVLNAASFLGYGMTAARKFRPQVWVSGAMTAALLAVAWFLIPRFSELGAAWALLISACAGLVGAAWVLRRELFISPSQA